MLTYKNKSHLLWNFIKNTRASVTENNQTINSINGFPILNYSVIFFFESLCMNILYVSATSIPPQLSSVMLQPYFPSKTCGRAFFIYLTSQTHAENFLSTSTYTDKLKNYSPLVYLPPVYTLWSSQNLLSSRK